MSALIPTAGSSDDVTPAPEFVVGHRWPDGHIDQCGRIADAQFGQMLYGGDVMFREVGPWMRAPDDYQFKWVTPE